MGRFLKLFGSAGLYLSNVAFAGAALNTYLEGNVVHSRLIGLFGVGFGGICLLLHKIGDEIVKAYDPEHRRSQEIIREAKEEYGWGWTPPTPEGRKRREERERFGRVMQEKMKLMEKHMRDNPPDRY